MSNGEKQQWNENAERSIPRLIMEKGTFPVRPSLPIDPILCAGSIRLQKLAVIAGNFTATWISLFIAIMFPTTIDGWCGWNGKSGPPLTTQNAYAEAVNRLESYGVLAEQEDFNWKNRAFFKIFLVPKGIKWSRVIMDCRQLAAMCAKPFPVRFATIEEIFSLLYLFRKPSFAVCDFRHFFYEIALPDKVQRLFSTLCKFKLFTALVWPMGLSWSPWVGQVAASILILESARRCGFLVEYDKDASSPPPVIVCRNTANRVICVIFIWYDNTTVIATNTVIRDQIARQIEIVCGECAAIIKEPGIVKSEREASFLGIDVARREDNAQWRHNVENIERWRTTLEQFEECAKTIGTLTPRKISEIVGVCIWDWQISGFSIDTIGETLVISQKIGKWCTTRKSWDTPIPGDMFDEEIIAGLTTRMKNILRMSEGTNVWRTRERTPIPSLKTQHVFLASDAMNTRGAGIRWNDKGECSVSWCEYWDEEQRSRHINFKETFAAVRTVLMELRLIPDNTGIVIGVDNTTALFALRHFSFPGEPELSMLLIVLAAILKKRGIDLSGLHIPGWMMAADEPSRGDALITSKCRECLRQLKIGLEQVIRLRRVRLEDP